MSECKRVIWYLKVNELIDPCSIVILLLRTWVLYKGRRLLICLPAMVLLVNIPSVSCVAIFQFILFIW